MVEVTIYTKAPDETGDCPFCHRAKAFLEEKRISYTEHVLDPPARQELYDHLELVDRERTVPQIILTDDDGEEMRIGGFTELNRSGIESLFPNQAE